MTNKTSLTRTLMTACSILALSAVMYGCVGGGDDDAPATDVPDTSDMDAALGAAQMAAMTAATAAGTAADAATAAVMAVEGSMDLTATATAAFARAEDARDDAGAALVAAVAANNAAQAATTSADAEMYQAEAEVAQRAAEAAQMSAMAFAGIVSGIQQTMDDAADEATMLADAQAAAMTAAGAARLAADEAQGVADAVALITGPHSGQVIAARAAAAAAEMAAQAAEAASARAQDDTESADAMDEQLTAVGAQGTAEAQLAEAKSLQSTAQVVADAIAADKEATALAGAMTDARMYADAAKGHYEAAKGKAAAAGTQATMAREAADKAKAARTDYATANTKATEAEAAATRAEAAVPIAMQAMMDADSAATAAEAAETSADAGMYRDQAETANDTATAQHTGADGAGMAYMAARDARMEAQTAATVHVRGLLLAANAADVEDMATTTEVDEHADAVAAVAAAIAAEAITDDNGGGTAVPTWPADTPDDESTDEVDESAEGMLRIGVAPEGGDAALEFSTEAAEEDDANTTVDETIVTATKIDGLPGFMHGYSISDRGTHAIVFTDKQQGTPAVVDVTAATAKELTNSAVTAGDEVSKLGTKSGNMYTGVEFTPNNDTAPLTGTLTCAAAASCSVETAADGTITVTGYTFTGSREAREAVTAAPPAENLDYLAFGVWLTEADPDASPTVALAFGAFADGGSNAVVAAEVTGTASYTGAATGVYTAGSSVDYFQGRASLTANFGEPGTADVDEAVDDEDGIITGMIDNIVAGGNSMSDVISLSSDHDRASATDGNIDSATGAFTGNAHMGDPKVDGTVATYTYNGVWGGQFYNGTADDDATDANESHVAPGSVAGTFGVSGPMGEGDDAVTRSYVGAFGAHKD